MSMNKFESITATICVCFLLILLQINNCFGLFEGNFAHKGAHGEHHRIHLHFTEQELEASLTYAKNEINKLTRLENSISNSRIRIRNQTSSFGQLLDNLPDDRSKEYDRTAQIVLKASMHLFDSSCVSHGYDRYQCGSDISNYTIPMSDILDQCRSYQYNKKGVTTYRRLLAPYYKDGLYKIPNERSPSPRNISKKLQDLSRVDSRVYKPYSNSEGILDDTKSIALVQWAQFIEHDLVKTVQHTMGNNNPIECCERDSTSPAPRYIHPSCAPLKYEEGDTHECFNYVRSAIGINSNCKFGPAEQLNQATNALDLSQVYGPLEHVTNSLRSFHNGELKSTNDPHYPTLPISTDIQNSCMLNSTEDICYKSGDSRVNFNPYVTILYTIFLRSHNQIAKILHKAHRSWTDEKLFHKARRINIDIYNKIIFEEFAPIILGSNMADQINNEPFLTVEKNGAVSNEFATVGIRFYYSMMPGDLYLKKIPTMNEIESNTISEKGIEILKLKDVFYKPRNLSRHNELDRIMHAIINQNAMAMDTGYVGDVVKYMYRFDDKFHSNIGSDILALDINRGRDHGIERYVKYLEACTNANIEDWTDLEPFMSAKDLSKLKVIYGSISEIDLIVGAIAENPIVGATVGPTFLCIIGEQLSNTRRTAPHFYSRDSENRYHEIISEYTAARLICDCTKLEFVPTNIFYQVSESNPLISCSTLKSMPKLAAYAH